MAAKFVAYLALYYFKIWVLFVIKISFSNELALIGPFKTLIVLDDQQNQNGYFLV